MYYVSYISDNMTYLIPVSIPDTWVTNGVQDGQVDLELVNLALDAVGNSPWAGLFVEHLGQLVHRPPHLTDLRVDLLGIQVHKRTWVELNKLTIKHLNTAHSLH